MRDKEMFIKGLMEKDKIILSKIKKTDFHNHASYSCDKRFLEKHNIVLGNDKIYNIQTLMNYCGKYINPIKQHRDGLFLLLKGNFENCINTGVSYVSTDIDYRDCIRAFNSNIDDFINFLKQFKYDSLKID